MDLFEEEQAEILMRYRGWLIKTARLIAPSRPNEWQDLAQEGWVAMWRALKGYDPSRGAEASWLTRAAHSRMVEVHKRQTWTGTPMARGHIREPPAVPVDTDWDWTHDAYIEKAYDDVWTAYHQGQIADALSRLDPSARIVIEKIMTDSGRYSWRTYLNRLDDPSRDLLIDLLAHLESDS